METMEGIVSSTSKTPRSGEFLPEGLPYVEQYYPRQMSWYAGEGPQGRVEELGRWIRENPWKAMAVGLIAGVAVSQVDRPFLAECPAPAQCSVSGRGRRTWRALNPLFLRPAKDGKATGKVSCISAKKKPCTQLAYACRAPKSQ
jgi:hypothetical protein